MSSLHEQAEAVAERLVTPASVGVRLRAFYELGKPNLSALVVVTGVIGFYIASPSVASWKFLHLVLGTFFTACGACGLNMFIERELDGRMRRTRGRPIPSGRLQPREALRFSLAAFGVGFIELLVFTNPLTAGLSLLTLLVYVFAYTPLKRHGPIATWVGAIPGAIPPVMGWAAARGSLDAPAFVLFGVLFFWQMPHFLALAWIFRDDYRRVGYRLLPGTDGTARLAGVQMALCALALIGVSLLLVPFGGAGRLYAGGALLAGLAFLAQSLRVAWRGEQGDARRLFLASLVYLPVLLTLIVADRWL